MSRFRGRGSLICIVALFAAGQIGLAALPALVDTSPLVLLALRPQTEVVVLVAHRLPTPQVLAVAVPLRFFLHVCYYEAGRWGGPRLLARSRAGRWLLRAMDRPAMVRALIVLALLHPSTPLDLALGTQRARRRAVYPVLAAGALVWTWLLVRLGMLVSEPATQVVAFLARHRTAAFVVAGPLALIATLGFLRGLRKDGDAVTADTVDDAGGDRGGALLAAARTHYEAFPFLSGGDERVRRWTVRLRRDLPDHRISGAAVLDVGCGSAEVAQSLADRGARMVCIDLTRAAVQRAHARNLPSCQASALALPFRTGAFHHTVSIGVLHHTPDTLAGLREVARVTRAGGLMVILLYSRWTPYHLLYAATGPLRRRVPAARLRSLPRWLRGCCRVAFRLLLRTRLDDEQIARLLADQFWTPRAAFHSPREVRNWQDQVGARIVGRRWIPLYSNLFVMERLGPPK